MQFFRLVFLTTNHAHFNRKTNRNKENYTVSRINPDCLHRLWFMSMMCVCMSVFVVFNLFTGQTVLHLFPVNDYTDTNRQYLRKRKWRKWTFIHILEFSGENRYIDDILLRRRSSLRETIYEWEEISYFRVERVFKNCLSILTMASGKTICFRGFSIIIREIIIVT